tara:strand:- start:566 stop:814 length:249 start_codon:yes stop_codon:yes gene_type:complete
MNIFTYFLIKLIKCYQFLISPLLGNSCRYLPSCSDYAIDSLKTYGLLKGFFLSIKRVFSCHPWGKGGFDPVKKEMKDKNNGL